MTGFGRTLADLNAAEVGYVLIGGIALIRHGAVRATRDVDAMLRPGEENMQRVRELVRRWSATRPDGSQIGEADLLPGKSVHLATPHGELDLMAELAPPLSFEALYSRSEIKRVDGVPAPICSLADLVAMKRLAGRERDLVDLSDLEAAHGELPDSRYL